MDNQPATCPEPTSGAVTCTDQQKNTVLIVYILQALSFVVGITSIAGVIINYLKRDEVRGTWLASHVDWQIKTFWYTLIGSLIGFVLMIVGIGVLILLAMVVWYIYRSSRAGWPTAMARNCPMLSSEAVYRHRFIDGRPFLRGPGKVVCVGRNYAAHARELGNSIPYEALLFIMPATALVALEQPLVIARRFQPCHYETEISVLIGKTLTEAAPAAAREAIAGIGVALDLTLRELQDR